MQKNKLILITFVFLISLIGTLLIGLVIKKQPTPALRACTMEAKLCPDGSSVGRTGPQCEFVQCPGISLPPSTNADTSQWKTYRNETAELQLSYPDDWRIETNSGGGSIIVTIASVEKEKYVHGLGIPPRGAMEVTVTKSNCNNSSDIFATYDNSPGLYFFEKTLCVDGFKVIGGYTDHHQQPLSEQEVKERKDLVEAIIRTTGSISTTSWKTYRNDKYGFEMRYPSSWVEHPRTNRTILSNVSTFSELSDESLKNEAAFTISIIPDANPQEFGITQWFDDFFKGGFANDLLSKSTVEIAGRQAIKIETVGIGEHAHYYIPLENDIIEISYPIQQPLFQDIYSRILSSFSIK